jgi:hypothetical protein
MRERRTRLRQATAKQRRGDHGVASERQSDGFR